ncbi:NAD-glutamate dehydrogenase [Hoyosella sp. YIM 151337]|uniref:NAD-glutamate dehydrogenase n=1 Tax=Hoyosella sp. YIM 151337 TaxID=2992742 RepID=UPI002235AA86|nr:NAD-glutamate dehydrogenase [Hoyosella sp. YIM 151337]MCW4354263.1 NAD-glutamate dehydrogenase [Hoyosella sp. YIM 151337]
MRTHPRAALAEDREAGVNGHPPVSPQMTFLAPSSKQQPAQIAALVSWPDGAPLLAEITATFERFGLRVADREHLPPRDGAPPKAELHQFWFRAEHATTAHALDRVAHAFTAAHTGHFEVDNYAVLIAAEDLSWRDVVLIRAGMRFLRQAGLGFSHTYIIATLLRHRGFARALVTYFAARFDPASPNRTSATETAKTTLTDMIEQSVTVDDDRILRALTSFVSACLRTNWYQLSESGATKTYASFMLEPAQLDAIPASAPMPSREIFVHSPEVEGVHVRSGLVARGGLRLSDRTEDFRTEVLGLLKTQIVKNSPIVPVGAKGAFVRRTASASPAHAYTTFIRGLLDVMDNVVEGAVVAPPHTVTYGGPDAYLVVAADKGTARFSDLANSVAIEKGFWLGDAFASGGSAGYDHKAMGITARGAWVCVQQHFKTLGIDVERDTIRVVGIGDMSGDVFGNGMLLSRSLKLVAAFDHRHIVIDPDPDPERSYQERARLFAQPGSTWGDYDRDALSAGGCIWPRSVKRIPLSPTARAALGVDTHELTPGELIKAILAAPVDLLWNGGVGTYVKSSAETHADAADPANDAVRIDASQLRCRAVGEGGNLGVTQAARIEYALRGGRINADFIDNAAGVATSDREVNLKIALGAAVQRKAIDLRTRDRLLYDARATIAADVLETNSKQDRAISLAESHAPALVHRHERLISHLEGTIGLDRAAESLPARRELASRAQRGRGLTRPEIAVLLAHSKNVVKADILASPVPDDTAFRDALFSYFPPPIRAAARAEIENHHLARDIIATRLADDLINHVGPGLIYRLEDRLAVKTPAVARAYAVVRAVFGVDTLWTAAQRFGEPALHALQRFIEHAASWLLCNRAADFQVTAESERYTAAVAALTREHPLPNVSTAFVSWLEFMVDAFAFHETALACSHPVAAVAEAFHHIGTTLGLDWVAAEIRTHHPVDWWESMGLASIWDALIARQHELTGMVVALPGDAVNRWQCVAADPIARFTRLSTEMQRDNTVDAARASTLNAELALLIRSTRACITTKEG